MYPVAFVQHAINFIQNHPWPSAWKALPAMLKK